MKKMMRLFIVAIISLSSAFFVLGGKAEVEAAHCGLGKYYDVANKKCADTASSSNQEDNVNKIAKSFEYFAYTVIYLSTGLALIIIVYAGFQYTMSEGDPFKIQEAKTWLLRAGIGMLIAFSAHSILGLFDAFSTL